MTATDAQPVTARVDRKGRLVSADPPLARLQQAAGSALGRPLAIPQLAALARSALSLVVPLSRAVLTADDNHDLDLWVRAEPDADGVTLTVERWSTRAAAPPRLSLVASTAADEAGEEAPPPHDPLTWTTDAELHLTAVSAALANLLGVDAGAVIGKPLTRLFRLVEDEDGNIPLLAALAARDDLAGQKAVPRGGDDEAMTLSAQPMHDADGRFTGFDGRVTRANEVETQVDRDNRVELDHALDEALRSPLDRIIESADRIVDRTDGPLRSDYASYASDIAAAGRHLMSVIRSMSDEAADHAATVDIAVQVTTAVGLVEPVAAARQVEIEIDHPELRMLAHGEGRAIVQILVNILGNAIRHSPPGGTVAVVFEQDTRMLAVTVADQGPGIDSADQQRIFERYERIGDAPDGIGLGLAISRRLARSMGGDIALVSAPGEGARFTLRLPAASV